MLAQIQETSAGLIRPGVGLAYVLHCCIWSFPHQILCTTHLQSTRPSHTLIPSTGLPRSTQTYLIEVQIWHLCDSASLSPTIKYVYSTPRLVQGAWSGLTKTLDGALSEVVHLKEKGNACTLGNMGRLERGKKHPLQFLFVSIPSKPQSLEILTMNINLVPISVSTCEFSSAIVIKILVMS